MIGMNQIKKRLIHGILIGLGVGIVGIIIVLVVTNSIIKGYEEGTSEKFNQQYMTQVVTFNRDVIQGETVTADMIQTANIPLTTLPMGAYTNSGALVGQVVKYNVPRNVAIISSMLANYIVGADVRIQEINAIVLPSDLSIGEYVDIRLMMPSGIEYIVLAQKQVDDIVGDTIKLDLSEEEILTLNGAIVDSYLTDGSKLYAVKYTDPTTQIKISTEEMADARTYIAEKLAAELIEKGAIAENTVETVETVETIVDAVVNDVTAATDDGTVLTPATDTTETITVPADKYIFSTSTLTADELLELISKYAIEYRYYVESFNKVEANYQPNSELMSYMKTHTYILDTAKERLNADIRRGMEASILNFENNTGDAYQNVVSGIESSVSTQKALRGAALNGQVQ